MSSRISRLLALLAVAAALPACGNVNDGHPAVPFTSRASVSTRGVQGNQQSGFARVSGNGRYVVFSTISPLVLTDTNGFSDVYRRDLQTGVTVLVSQGVGGIPASSSSSNPSISADGRWVAFQSTASNLVAPAVPGLHVYARDMNAPVGTGIVLVSEVGGLEGDDVSLNAVVSGDGNFVAFESMATTFGDAHFNGVPNIYRKDLTTGDMLLVSLGLAGDPTPGAGFEGSTLPSISRDGSAIAFTSDCTDLVAGDANALLDVFVATVSAGVVTMAKATQGPLGVGTNGNSQNASISADGAFVAYSSSALNLVPPDANLTTRDVYVTRLSDLSTRRVSVNADGFQTQLSADSDAPSISADGTYVAFESAGSNLVPGGNPAGNVFIKNMVTGEVVLASVDSSGNVSSTSQLSQAPSLSDDGRTIVFVSQASFVKDDDNGVDDVYVRSPLR